MLNNKPKVNQLFKVPNSIEGKYFLHLCEKYMNHDSYTLKLRGRTPNHKLMKKEGKTTKNYYYGVPLKYAENIGVYLVAKGKGYPVIGISMVENSEYWKKRAYENFNVEQEHKHNKDLLNAIKNITERMVNQ